MSWEVVIGLEIHAQLNTQSKIFSGAATAYGAAPNTQACAVDLALPGVLPVLNKAAVHKAIQFGLAVEANINRRSIFARKNYFYPDLPKGYQISQNSQPIVQGGKVSIVLANGREKEIHLTRAHLEEDAGKSIHGAADNMTGIDLNRAGTPLLEIVSEPELRSAEEAVAYLKTIHALVRYLDISDGNMQEGSFRCDVNVSVRPAGQAALGTRAELKNLNSFKFVEQAIHIETMRQIELIEDGGTVKQETRLFDPERGETRSMRGKEDAMDYRYFPDPDLLPVVIKDELIESLRSNLPELPKVKCQRFQDDYALSKYDASLLTSSRALANYFESVCTADANVSPKKAANWITGALSAAMNEHEIEIEHVPVSAAALAQLIIRVADQTISSKIAKTVFEACWQTGKMPDDIIAEKGLTQITDTGAIEKIIDDIIANNAGQAEQYRQGKHKVFGFFVGQVMKATQGKASPEQVNELLKAKLEQ